MNYFPRVIIREIIIEESADNMNMKKTLSIIIFFIFLVYNNYALDIYGDWYIEEMVGTCRFFGLSDDEIDAFINKQVHYYKDVAVLSNSSVCYEPIYSYSEMDENEFFVGFRATIEDIGAQTNNVHIIEIKYIENNKIYHFLGPGSLLIFFDDTLCTFWNGVFFKLKRVE